MTTQYTPILKLALPVTGELSGTWGTVVNDNITSMVEQAVAGLSTINTWTANAHTLTTADGTSSEARCAMLVLATGAGGTALTAAGEVICPAASKLYVVKNGSAYAVTVKTSAGTGVAIPAGDTAFVFCDGTNVNACVTTIVNGHISGNLTVDGNTTLGDAATDTITATAQFNTDLLPSTDNARDLGSTAKSWRTLYCETSVIAANITISGNTISSTDTNGNITLAPNGTGDVQLDADTIRVGDSGANVTITSNGAGDLILNTNSGTNSGSITIEDGANGNIALAPNGTGQVTISTALDLTNLEVTNIKAKDGSASITLADSTGVASFTANPILSGGTANGVVYLNASKVATSGSALTFDGSEIFKNSGGTIQNNDVRGSAAAGTRLSAGGTLGVDSFDLFQNAVGGYVFNRGNTPLIFGANNAEWMRLTSTGTLNIVGAGTAGTSQAVSINGSAPTNSLVILGSSGNVGLGTDTPGAKLNTSIAAGSASATNIHYLLSETGTNSDTGMQIKAINSTNSWDAGSITFRREGAADSYGLVFATSSGGTNNNRLFLNSSGNLGLGVTPSAWVSTHKALQMNWSAFSTDAGNGETSVSTNAYASATTTWNYRSTAPASRYTQDYFGKHIWYTAASGTAGNVISFTQAMTLDASGNLVVGDTTAGARLHVSKAGAGTIEVAWINNAQAVGANVGSRLVFTGTTNNNGLAAVSGAFEGATTADGGYMTFATRAVTSGTLTERARITSGGDLQIANGNLVMSTSGKGIDFSATSSGTGTMTSELLADYEEGTWTPTATFATPGTVSTSLAVGLYTKVGNVVTAVGRIAITKGTASGNLVLGGLPFASNNTTSYQVAGTLSTDTFGVAGTLYQMLLASNSTVPEALAVTQSTGITNAVTASDFYATAGTLRFAFTYQI